MNIHVDHPVLETEPIEIVDTGEAGRRGRDVSARRRNMFRAPGWLRLKRTAFGSLTIGRIMRGGRVSDAGRLPRYVTVIGVLTAAIWVPVFLYLNLAEVKYSSDFSLILPGNGVSTSVNLTDIGQASTSANSAYSSSSISPTVTYKKLLQSQSVIKRAEEMLLQDGIRIGYPRIKLVDQTSLIQVMMEATSPETARQYADALLSAFLAELEKLRQDEIERRQGSTVGSVKQYQEAVDQIRNRISQLQMESGLTTADQFQEIAVAKEELVKKMTDLKGQHARQSRLVESLASLLDISPENAAVSLRLHADVGFQTLLNALSEETAKLAELSQSLGDKHPNIVSLRKRVLGARLKLMERGAMLTGLGVETLQNEIEHSTEGQRASLLSQLMDGTAERDGLEAELAILKDELQVVEKRLISLLSAASELDSLNRDYKVAEAVFASALARSNTFETDVFASYPMVQIIEAPTYSQSPSSPNTLLAILFGIAATLCAIGGLVLFWIRQPLIAWITARPSGEED